MSTTEGSPPIRTVGVLGGGSAGYLTALALRKRLPALQVTLIDTSRIPIIGVGEATTPTMVPFLHDYLGLDRAPFYAEVKPTWKLGVRLYWGIPGDSCFNFPFDGRDLSESYAYTGDINACSLGSLLMTAQQGPILQRADWSYEALLGRLPFAYHLDNARFVRYLTEQARLAGVTRVEALIDEVEVAGQDTVTALRADDGRRFSFDLYVDCSGFRSRLLGQALRSPFISFDESLFTDTAVVANRRNHGRYGSYTYAESMDCGWCWSIPEVEEDHRGYVFSSRFLSADAAEAEMRRKNPTMGEAHLVRFRSGRHAHFWKGNVVGIGNAYAFVEPLESTALHMVLREISNLVAVLRPGAVDSGARERLNQASATAWEYIRGHLAVHYRFNRKLDTAFWRACHAEAALGGHEEMVAAALAHGPLVGQRGQRFGQLSYALDNIADETDLLLLGQRVIPDHLVVPRQPREEWMQKLARLEGHRRRALASRAALEVCLQDPALTDASGARWYQTLLRTLEEPFAVRDESGVTG